MSWKTEIQKVANNANQFINNATNKVSTFFSGNISQVKTTLNASISGGGHLIGINVGHIPAMKKAIGTYVKDVNDKLDKLKDLDPEITLKGTKVAPEVQGYLVAVKEACFAITSYLNAFSDQLTDIEEAYATKDEESANKISGSSEETRAAYQAYQGAAADSK